MAVSYACNFYGRRLLKKRDEVFGLIMREIIHTPSKEGAAVVQTVHPQQQGTYRFMDDSQILCQGIVDDIQFGLQFRSKDKIGITGIRCTSQ